MNNKSTKKIIIRTAAAFPIALFACMLFSFTIYQKAAGDISTMLGMAKPDVNSKITNSILGGYMNAQGVKNIKAIATGNKTAVAKDLLAYTKQYVNSDAFKNAYAIEKEQHKPADPGAPQTPDEYKKQMIANAQDNVKKTQGYVDNATAANKPIFQPALDQAKKDLADAQKPDNKELKIYTQNYAQMLSDYKNQTAERNRQWQMNYPDDYKQFVKKRLQEFLDVTKDVDFSAELTEKNGKKYFVNPVYEHKDYRWKMVYRAGKDVTDISRAFVQQWLSEIQ